MGIHQSALEAVASYSGLMTMSFAPAARARITWLKSRMADSAMFSPQMMISFVFTQSRGSLAPPKKNP